MWSKPNKICDTWCNDEGQKKSKNEWINWNEKSNLHFYSKWPSFTCWFIFHVYFYMLFTNLPKHCRAAFLKIEYSVARAYPVTDKMQSTYQISTCGNISKSNEFSILFIIFKLTNCSSSTWNVFLLWNVDCELFSRQKHKKNKINAPFEMYFSFFTKNSHKIYSSDKIPRGPTARIRAFVWKENMLNNSKPTEFNNWRVYVRLTNATTQTKIKRIDKSRRVLWRCESKTHKI